MEYIDFATRHWDLFAILLFIVALLFWNFFRHKIQGYSPVTPEEAVLLINQKDCVILDVRTDKEIDRGGKIAKSKMINLKLVSDVDANQIGKTDMPVLVFCSSGNRSTMACSKLKKKGFVEIYNLTGGIAAWKKANLPTIKN